MKERKILVKLLLVIAAVLIGVLVIAPINYYLTDTEIGFYEYTLDYLRTNYFWFLIIFVLVNINFLFFNKKR